jgi:hypothetical protein
MTPRTVTVDADDLETLLRVAGIAADLEASPGRGGPGAWAVPWVTPEWTERHPVHDADRRALARLRDAHRGGGRGTGGADTSAQRSANVPPAPDTAPPPNHPRILITHDPPGPTGPHLAALRLGAGLSRRIPR